MSVTRLRWLYRAWRYRYRLEPREIGLLSRQLRPGDTAVDIGAHKGAYSYWMRKAVGASGAVYAFEPQPVLATRLAALVVEVGYRNVRVENLALSSAAGTMTLTVPGSGTSPGASLEPGAGRSTGITYPVKVTTLDAYFAGPERDGIRLIKCDAEGHELEVFRGGQALLEQARPVLLFECEQRHRRGSVAEVFGWLQERGYRGFYIDRDGPQDIEGFDPGRHQARSGEPGYVNNFLFLPLEPSRRGADSGAAS
jgi:FkbM family methyltransferase